MSTHSFVCFYSEYCNNTALFVTCYLITLIINSTLAPSTLLTTNKHSSLTQRCLLAIEVVIRSKRGWWSRSHNSERLSWRLPTTPLGCRDRHVPSHTRSHIRISSAEGQACRTNIAAHARARARPGLKHGCQAGGQKGWRKAPDEPSHSSSSQASGLL